MTSDGRKDIATVLLRLTERLSSCSLEGALQEVTDAAVALLPADHASVRLLDASRTQLLTSARSGTGTDRGSLAIKPGEGIAGWVIAQRMPAHVKDTREDPRFMEAVGQGFKIRSMIAEPLMSAGRVIGVLSLSSPEVDAFSAEDMLVARLLANCSVPAIERARLERLAATDEMTLAYTGRYLLPRVSEEIERARGAGTKAVALLSLDLDRFKHVNESYGQAVGDRVLCIFVERVRAATRVFDVLVRTGGDEFMLLLPQAGADDAKAMAERVRKAVGETAMEPMPGAFMTQTVSIGIASWRGDETAAELRDRAEHAMHAAKDAGRDRAVVARG
jgi:diguanylate cyclase (GGDEF)-like protein